MQTNQEKPTCHIDRESTVITWSTGVGLDSDEIESIARFRARRHIDLIMVSEVHTVRQQETDNANVVCVRIVMR